MIPSAYSHSNARISSVLHPTTFLAHCVTWGKWLSTFPLPSSPSLKPPKTTIKFSIVSTGWAVKIPPLDCFGP